MKISNIIVLIVSFILIVSCESENNSNDENNSLIGEWKLVKRNGSFLIGPHKSVKLEIFSDSTVVYSDSLLNYFWQGQIIHDSGFFIDFENNIEYVYLLGENWFIDDSLKTYHFKPSSDETALHFFDTYIKNSNY